VDNYRFRDVRSGQGPVNIGRGTQVGRDYVDNRGGQYVGGDYNYQDRRSYRQGDNYDVQVGPTDPFDAVASGRGVGRLLTAIGMLVAFAGFGGVAYLIVSLMTKIGPDMDPGKNPFATPFPDGFPVLSGFTILPVAGSAFLLGGILAGIGASMAKAARRRHDQRMRQRRGYY
jgi:hypothetical protein